MSPSTLKHYIGQPLGGSHGISQPEIVRKTVLLAFYEANWSSQVMLTQFQQAGPIRIESGPVCCRQGQRRTDH